tara:strand:- start:2112 stop:2690 length:579 start_codon:yes stop_codon:yes gene_type:complete
MKKIYNKNAREKALLEEAYSEVYTEKDYCCGPDKSKKRLGSSRPARQGSERRLHSAVGGYRVGKGDPKVIRPQRNQWAISGDEEVETDGERWSEEYGILDVTSTEDLEYAEGGDAFLFDKVDEFAQAEGEVIETESDVMKFLSQFGSWELKDNPYGAIVVKVGDILDDPEHDAKYETEYTDSYRQRQGGREF